MKSVDQDESKNSPLSKFFDVLATSVDRNGRPFVAVIQGKTLPMSVIFVAWPLSDMSLIPVRVFSYGAQFHSEKIQFVNISKEDPHIPKTPEAVAGAKYLAEFFVNEVRKNKH